MAHLDNGKFNYIPIADWAALRDATILSDYSDQRKGLYLALLDKYKDYIQDNKSCVRFVKNWMKKPEHFADIKLLCMESPEYSELDISVPEFKHLKPNIDFKRACQKVLQLN